MMVQMKAVADAALVKLAENANRVRMGWMDTKEQAEAAAEIHGTAAADTATVALGLAGVARRVNVYSNVAPDSSSRHIAPSPTAPAARDLALRRVLRNSTFDLDSALHKNGFPSAFSLFGAAVFDAVQHATAVYIYIGLGSGSGLGLASTPCNTPSRSTCRPRTLAPTPTLTPALTLTLTLNPNSNPNSNPNLNPNPNPNPSPNPNPNQA